MKKLWYLIMGIVILGIVLNPQKASENAYFALSLCGSVIIPSLLPFFVCSAILVNLGFADFIGKPLNKIMRPVFNVSGKGALALVMGILSGYPVGAAVVAGLYKNGDCSKIEAERMLTFCNNSGPLFVMGAVGVGMFASEYAGKVLYLSHVAAAIVVGVLFRFYKRKSDRVQEKAWHSIENNENIGVVITEAVAKSAVSMLNICGFVVSFYVLARLISDYKISEMLLCGFKDGQLKDAVNKLIMGMVEMSTGIKNLVAYDGISQMSKICGTSFLLGFAGISVYFQTMGMVAGCNFSMKPYVLGKLLQGTVSAVISWGIMSFAPGSAEAFLNQTQNTTFPQTTWVFLNGAHNAGWIWVISVIIIFFALTDILCQKMNKI